MDNHKKSNKQTKESATENKKLFIKNYPEYGTIGSTLKAIGIKSRTTFYNWLNDKKFNDIYENELKPNRRDDVVSVVYRVASGKMKIDSTQLTAAFGFLKATDHISEDITKDRLVFCEKNQVEFMGRDGKPIEPSVTFQFLSNNTKQLTERLIQGGVK